jgi:uncharacterized protein YjbI with pentapeptide repeats
MTHPPGRTLTLKEVVSRTGRPRRPDSAPSLISAATDGSDLVRVTVQGDFSGLRSPDITAEEAHILRASFVGAQLARTRLSDVLVEGADLSGTDLGEASLSRVAFIDCRMSGVQLDRTRVARRQVRRVQTRRGKPADE